MYEIIHEKVHKFILIPNGISCKIHGSLTSSVYHNYIATSKAKLAVLLVQNHGVAYVASNIINAY